MIRKQLVILSFSFLPALLLPPMALADDAIRIGAIFSLTGSGQQYGDWSRKGAEIAVNIVNEQGGIRGRPIRIIFEDSQNQTNAGIAAFQKLVSRDKVTSFLIHGSTVSVPIEPLSNRARVVQMDVGSTTLAYKTDNDFTFRTAITAIDLSAGLAKALIARGIKGSGLLYVGDEYGTSMANSFRNEFTRFGGVISTEQAFFPSETDFATVLLRFRSVSAIVLVARYDKAGLIVSQARRLGLQSVFYSDVYSIESRDFLNLAGHDADGVTYVAPTFREDVTPEAKLFVERYQKRFNESAPQLAAQAFDGILALTNAYRECPTEEPECLKSALNKMRFVGANGPISFDPSGDVTGWATVLKHVEKGRFEELR